MAKYTIGLDFGTLSARAVLVDVSNGLEISMSSKEYASGVINTVLPNTDIKLKEDWALQDPKDYLDVLYHIIPDVIEKSGVNSEDIIGVGVDFTSCTILPIDSKGNPLCFYEKHRKNPYSWAKLWKDHSAQYYADILNELAIQKNEEFLRLYGGKISSEWMIPKLMQMVSESPETYDQAHSFIEAGDWIVFKLTGQFKRNCCAAGFKATWNSKLGYPSGDFLKMLHPKLENLVEDKLSNDIFSIGTKAGYVNEEIAKKTGLKDGTAVSVASIDAHVAFPAMGISSPGNMVIIVGTSTCNILIDEREIKIPGISGVVKDAVIPGYYGYEAGQAAVGDIFNWFINNCVPVNYVEEARNKKITIFELLNEKSAKLKPGETGLLCLDWLNGNRSTLIDADLSGMILGLTLSTKPEEIYRALIEATAFGQNMIVETFRNHGIKIDSIYACGGISKKNPLLMQIYADVMNMNIKISESDQAVALGAAMFGAVSAGNKSGGYDSIEEAASRMGRLLDIVYKPIETNVEAYQAIYKEYKKLYNYFGRENDVMKKLKKMKSEY
ncbi:ribulokinase [Maledivibacter halophilus]|uniref:Ribulokinase n=1 Tax=Maledivibacter halophilus TaxID=36842 RepID=A0A1T5J6R2_9FIRM|nr:ribulokinase [Maledivibacter halophilus]SKC47071.1 L-ribulokinase [Maledivibacter halophilus]